MGFKRSRGESQALMRQTHRVRREKQGISLLVSRGTSEWKMGRQTCMSVWEDNEEDEYIRRFPPISLKLVEGEEDPATDPRKPRADPMSFWKKLIGV